MPAAAPRFVVTDALGRRIVPIDTPFFSIGRKIGTDLRVPGADIGRLHAEITLENGRCTIRDKQSRFGTFINGERVTEKVLAHGDVVRFGQADDVDIVFYIDEETPSLERGSVESVRRDRQVYTRAEDELEKAKHPDPPENWDDKDGWDRYYDGELLSGRAAAGSTFALRFLSFAREKGGRIWFPGCGLDPSARLYAEQGCKVVATDWSPVAVRYQQGLAAAVDNFAVAEHDFTRDRLEGEFDVVINCRAFQGLSSDAMHKAAAHFHAALRPGGAAIIDTINVAGSSCSRIEDSLLTAGFYIPYQKSERWYRQQLESTGIAYGMVLGRPHPLANQYPQGQFNELSKRDRQILDSFTAEYERRRKEEGEEVNAIVNDPESVVAHVVYSTG